MLQDMDTMEASCIIYVKVGIFNQHNQSKICLLTVNNMRIVRLIVQHNLIVSVSFLYYLTNFLRQTLAIILSLEECHIYI